METFQLLRTASLAFIVGFVLHNADHARRGLSDTPEATIWLGTLLGLIVAVTLTLVFTRHPGSPEAALVTGLATALGVTAIHLLPSWSPASEPLTTGGYSYLTWVAVMAEILGGVALGAAGWVTVNHKRHKLRQASSGES